MYEGFLDEKLTKGKKIKQLKYPFEGGEPLKEEVQDKVEGVFRSHGSDARNHAHCRQSCRAIGSRHCIGHPHGSPGQDLESQEGNAGKAPPEGETKPVRAKKA